MAWKSGDQENDSFPELTADLSFAFLDHDRILFASEQDGWNHLYSVSSSSGGQATLLTPGQFEVEDVTPSLDRKSVLYSSNQDDIERRHLWRVSLDGGTPVPLTKGETIEWSPVEIGSNGQVFCLGSSATTPAMPYQLNQRGREMLAAKALPADFPAQQLVVPQTVVFKSEDGLDIHGQLFVPSGRSQRGPALIFMHGGPIRQMMPGFHYMDYYHNAYAMNQYLASQGYVVLSVNYRLGDYVRPRIPRGSPHQLARSGRVQRHRGGREIPAQSADRRPEENWTMGWVLWRIPDRAGACPQFRSVCGGRGLPRSA